VYCATQEDHEGFGPRVLTMARRAGAEAAKDVAFIGDGAKRVRGLCGREFARFGARVVEVLDWYHAVEHLWEVARAYYGGTSDLETPWVKAREGNCTTAPCRKRRARSRQWPRTAAWRRRGRTNSTAAS
jgi:hypothetical protein